jgi:hypothetical protein
LKTVAAGVALLALTVPAFAQGGSLQDVVAGKDAPLTLHLKDLNSDWKRLTIATAGSGGGMGDLMSQIMPLAMMGGGGPKGKDDMMGMAFFSSLFGGGGGASQPVYYTKGQTTAVGGETFLIAYKYDKPEINFMQLVAESEKNGGKEPDFAKMMAGSKLTPDSPLSLSLLNVRSINTMSGIRAFDMGQEIADSAKGPGGLLEMLMGMSKAEPAEAAKTAPIEAPGEAPDPVTAPVPAKPKPPAKPKAPAKKKGAGR